MPKLPLLTTAAVLVVGLSSAPSAFAASPTATVSATAVTKALSTKGSRATVTVRNTGGSRLTGLTLRPAGLKGVRATISGARSGVRSLRPLKAGGTVRITVTLRRLKGGPTAGAFGLRLRKGKVAVASGRIAFGPRATPAPTESLVGRYYWGSLYTIGGTQQYNLYFTGPDLVYTGEIDGAVPTCAAASETCRPYAFDARTKALTVDGKPATLDGAQLELDGQAYFRLGVPKPGARWNAVLTYANSFGTCPLYCNYVREDLTFLPDGTFVLGTINSGSGPVVDYAAIPADKRGTYEIRADRTLRLAFADGKERVEVVGAFPGKDGVAPENPTDGIVLDGDGYFDIRD